jgi:hypothetical protein
LIPATAQRTDRSVRCFGGRRLMNDQMGRIEHATESTIAKVITRFVVPSLLMIISFFLVLTLNGIKNDVHDQGVKQGKQGDDIASIKSDVRDVNTRLDSQVIRQVDTNTKNINVLDQRVQILERSVKTP